MTRPGVVVSLLVTGYVASLPLLVVPYSATATTLLSAALDYQFRRTHEPWLYASFLVAAAAVIVAAPVPLVVSPHPFALAAVPLGAMLYWIDTRLWAWWTGSRIQATDRSTGWIVTTLLGPFPEEIIYRGGLSVLLPTFGPAAYTVVSAVLYGTNHYHIGRKEVAFKAWNGVLYAALYVAAGTLVVPLAAHLAYNVASLSFVREGSRG
ncbi:hypothetical protein BRC83_03575 [Halobacteriales archaeon QS_1_68_17]|nr:MAG: hypothetical protein BRC83_03575 [Halobacteriales archaeon QS_1_68_17]